MKCEHAQEFFSEYIEQSLDKPTGVAVEAHLTACAGCRRGVEGLRQTWGALNAVPVVEPPKDLAWRVMVQLQQERLDRLEAERQRRNPFTAWLQSLTPGAAFGYATLTALLIVAIAFPLSSTMGVRFGWDRSDGTAVVQPVPSPTDQQRLASEPEITLLPAKQDAPGRPWYYPLLITTPRALGESRVYVTPRVLVNGQLSGGRTQPMTLVPEQPRGIPVPMTVGSQPVRDVLIRIQGSGRTIEKVLPVPELGGQGGF